MVVGSWNDRHLLKYHIRRWPVDRRDGSVSTTDVIALTDTHTHTHTHTDTQTYRQTHTHTHIYTQTHTHTHTQTYRQTHAHRYVFGGDFSIRAACYITTTRNRGQHLTDR